MSKYNNLTKEDLIKYIEELEKQLKSTKYGIGINLLKKKLLK